MQIYIGGGEYIAEAYIAHMRETTAKQFTFAF